MNYVFMFGIPVTAFPMQQLHALNINNLLHMVKDREILTRVQQPHVSI